MPSNRELGLQQAQQAAQQLAAEMPTGAGGPPSATTTLTPGAMPPELQSVLDSLTQAARASGTTVSYSTESHVVGDPSRPLPGTAGGGLTPEQVAAAISGGAHAAGLEPATARVLAAHDVPIPADLPGAPPAGTVDLTLDVVMPTGDGYSTTIRIGFSTLEKRSRVAVVGMTLPVLVNPAARDQVAIDTSRLG
jgi:hypothetical protein